MKVNFKRDWSYAEGRFRQRDNPNKVPDRFVNQLPSDAEVIESPKATPKPKPKVNDETKKDK
jgi:hypothetical protein|tara:strand:+ start:907 stop:1092 length:186 start_codon:yes stop_codon:yes gene_type:complete